MTHVFNTAGDWLARALRSAATSWSVGTFGALAEFARSPGEDAAAIDEPERHGIVTNLGAIRFAVPRDARLIAYEGLSKLPAYWSQGLSLCLPASAAARAGRTALTVIGEDEDAVRHADRAGVLVDLGIGAPHIDACVRIADEHLLRAIEPWFGKPLFTDGHAAAERLFEASPHRVFMSTAARIEVYGPIPPTDGSTPDGPHTHLLPDLLRHGRAFAANTPIPDGWLPILNAYPPNPARDSRGDPRPFDDAAHDAFQRLIEAYGPPELVAAKARVVNAVRDGVSPDTAPFDTRFERIAARVALRQLAFTDAPSDALAAWRTAFEPGVGEDDADPS